MARRVSCGVIVSDGESVLLGHATRSPRWDIPKGVAERRELPASAAVRELREETGLIVAVAALTDLGTHAYLPGKDLALFAWAPHSMPDPAQLVCTSRFALPDGRLLPEFDRFGLFAWDDALARVGSKLARVLGAVAPRLRGLAAGRHDDICSIERLDTANCRADRA
jgi:8-oxo-dGTP pyrophosphatase MutT (NUDIX family)